MNEQRSGSTPRSDLGVTEDRKLNVHREEKLSLFSRCINRKAGCETQGNQLALCDAGGASVWFPLEVRSVHKWDFRREKWGLACDVRNVKQAKAGEIVQ